MNLKSDWHRMIVIAVAGIVATGCELSGADDSPAGSYVATEWETTTNNVTTDQLAAGNTISLVLRSDGTTSGSMHVNASGGNPAQDSDLTGTWTMVGDRVHLSHAADTFLRDIEFSFGSKTLWAATVFGDTGVIITFNET